MKVNVNKNKNEYLIPYWYSNMLSKKLIQDDQRKMLVFSTLKCCINKKNKTPLHNKKGKDGTSFAMKDYKKMHSQKVQPRDYS